MTSPDDPLVLVSVTHDALDEGVHDVLCSVIRLRFNARTAWDDVKSEIFLRHIRRAIKDANHDIGVAEDARDIT